MKCQVHFNLSRLKTERKTKHLDEFKTATSSTDSHREGEEEAAAGPAGGMKYINPDNPA